VTDETVAVSMTGDTSRKSEHVWQYRSVDRARPFMTSRKGEGYANTLKYLFLVVKAG